MSNEFKHIYKTNKDPDELDRLFELLAQQDAPPGPAFEQTLKLLREAQPGKAAVIPSAAYKIENVKSQANQIAAKDIAENANIPATALKVGEPAIKSNPATEPLRFEEQRRQIQNKRYRNLVLAASLLVTLTAIGVILLAISSTNTTDKAYQVAVTFPPISPAQSPLNDSTSAHLTPQNTNTTTADLIPGSHLSFAYPGATPLDVVNTISTGAFATTTDMQVVASYYKQKLPTAGFTVFGDTPDFCGVKGCDKFQAGDGSTLLEIDIFSATAWKSFAGAATGQNFAAQLKQPLPPDQTLILYSYRVGKLPTEVTAHFTPTIAPTMVPLVSNGVDLNYPNATQLQVDKNYILQFVGSDEIRASNLAALATTDDYNKIADYYKQKLAAAGFTANITNNTIASICAMGCDAKVVEASGIDGSQIKIYVFSPAGMVPIRSGDGYGKFFKLMNDQLKANQNLVMLMFNLNSTANKATAAAQHTAISAYTPLPSATLFGPVLYQPVTVTPTPLPAPTATPLPQSLPANLKLDYPGATPLQVRADEALFPGQQPPSFFQVVAQTTNDDHQKILDFYRAKLQAATYKIGFDAASQCGRTTGGTTDCGEWILNAHTEQFTISFVIHNANAQAPNNYNIPLNVLKQLPTGQTLIYYTFSSLSPPPAQFPDETVPPPPTPVKAASKEYLGPDNLLHPGTDLVASNNNTKIEAESEASYYFDNLVSDANSTHLKLTIEYVGNGLTFFSPESGTLTDEAGHIYKLIETGDTGNNNSPTHTGGHAKDGKPFNYQAVGLVGPALPAGTRHLTFVPGDGLPFKPKTSLTLELKPFSESGLPQVTPLPNAAVEVGGIKLRVPYAYFGRDRTLLDLVLDSTDFGKNLLATGVGYNIQPIGFNAPPDNGTTATVAVNGPIYATAQPQHNTVSSSILDDRGQPLSLLAPYPNVLDIPFQVFRTGENKLILKPVAVGAKGVTISIPAINIDEFWAEPHYNHISAQAPMFNLPLAQLLQSGKAQPGGMLEVQGLQVQILGVQATLNKDKGLVTLVIKHQTVAGPNLKGTISNANVSIVCVKCDPNTSTLSRSTSPAGVIEDYLTFNYDQTQTDIQLGINSLGYTLNGPWQINIPIAQP